MEERGLTALCDHDCPEPRPVPDTVQVHLVTAMRVSHIRWQKGGPECLPKQMISY